MMLDQNIVAVSPMSVYRVLKAAGLIGNKTSKPSKKGTGFVQPLVAHDHWHIDVSYINIAGTFYYLCSVLDGYSRYIVHWEIRESMKESEIELILQRAREKFPLASPRIISDNGPQFIAKDFKEFIRVCGMTHVRTSPYYPQSNGKIERWHREYKETVIRPRQPRSLEEARDMTGVWITYYNDVRLHSALSYIAPIDQLEGRAVAIFEERDAKLESARAQRSINRQKVSDQQPPEKNAVVANDVSAEYNKSISSKDRALLGSNPSVDESLESIRIYEEGAVA
jgi:transposase-like protein